jgi:hypothetical protein
VIEESTTHLNIKLQCPRIFLIALFLLSSSSLCYEINITRLFSVTQFYHFAFLIVSLALLGYGTSGAFLAVFPSISKKNLGSLLTLTSFFTAISFLSAYLLTNYLPFDSFSITLGWKPIAVLLLHMVVLTVPFFFSGLSVILLIDNFAKQVNLIYGINLAGSAFGCVIALLLPTIFGAEGLVLICTLFSLIACCLLIISQFKPNSTSTRVIPAIGIITLVMFVICLTDLYLRTYKGTNLDFMNLKISPYKGISYAMLYPGAEIIYQEWNAYSRVDLVRSDGIRSFPGYSYMSNTIPPKQDGLFIDGDDLSPVIKSNEIFTTSSYMPSSIAYILRPAAEVLILEPRGGLEIAIARSEGVQAIVSSEPNSLIVEAAHNIYEQENLVNYLEAGRSYLKRSSDVYDVIVISLNSAFHPVRSGAYSLSEDYRYTIEAFEEALLHLEKEGLLVVTRWLQTPPTEFLKTFGIAIEAIDNIDGSPAHQIAAIRSYNTGTLIIKRGDLTLTEIIAIKDFSSGRAFDLVYYPGIQPGEVNRYNVLPEPYYYQTFTSLLSAHSREAWYRAYPYNVTPPSDDKPFFNQFFKWSQLPSIIAEFGRVWEPFGGAGFVILLLLLFLTMLLSFGFILTPTIISIKFKTFEKRNLGILGYFASIGLAFMFVEIPMIQHFILFLDNPAYSLTTVLFTLLLFSGLGSRASKEISINTAFCCLLLLSLLNIWLLKQVMYYCLGLPLIQRTLITVILLAPTGVFMGMPFPKGIGLLTKSKVNLVPWAWGVNGAFSVVAGVAAALIAISHGFRIVFVIGTALYLVAWVFIRVPGPHYQHRLQ